MALINKIRNIFLPILTVTFLLLFMPFSIFFKLLAFIRRCKESENVNGKVVIITGSSSGIGEVSSYFSLVSTKLITKKTFIYFFKISSLFGLLVSISRTSTRVEERT